MARVTPSAVKVARASAAWICRLISGCVAAKRLSLGTSHLVARDGVTLSVTAGPDLRKAAVAQLMVARAGPTAAAKRAAEFALGPVCEAHPARRRRVLSILGFI